MTKPAPPSDHTPLGGVVRSDRTRQRAAGPASDAIQNQILADRAHFRAIPTASGIEAIETMRMSHDIWLSPNCHLRRADIAHYKELLAVETDTEKIATLGKLLSEADNQTSELVR